MSATNDLNQTDGVRKVAIFLSSLDRKVALKILERLDPNLARAVRLELLTVFNVDGDVRRNVLADFIQGEFDRRFDSTRSIANRWRTSDRAFDLNPTTTESSVVPGVSFFSNETSSLNDDFSFENSPSESSGLNLWPSDDRDDSIGNDEISEFSNESSWNDFRSDANLKPFREETNAAFSIDDFSNSTLITDANETSSVFRLFDEKELIREDTLEYDEANSNEIDAENGSVTLGGVGYWDNIRFQNANEPSFENSESFRTTIPFDSIADRFRDDSSISWTDGSLEIVVQTLKFERPSIIATVLRVLPVDLRRETIDKLELKKKERTESLLKTAAPPRSDVLAFLSRELRQICRCRQCQASNEKN